MRLEQIREKIRDLKFDEKRAITNFYNQANLSTKMYEIWEAESTIIFWYMEMSVCHVMFYSYDEKELRQGLQQLPASATIHIVTKDKEDASVWEARIGYPLYAIYGRFGYVLGSPEEEKQRFAAMKLDRFYDEKIGFLAKQTDLREIQDLLYKTFDPYSDVLFTDERMKDLIDNGNVWIEREGQYICTVFVYQIEGKKYYANLALNHSTADVLHSIQKKSILQAIEEHGVTYFYGWQSLANMQASRKHGFPEYDLYDLIFKKG